MNKKELREYTRDDFLEMENFMPQEPFNEIVIVPAGEIHDSGYECMKFILLSWGKIVGVVSGWSDVAHINGIGGYGKNVSTAGVLSQLTKRVGWAIDCLPGSHCLRLFSDVACEADEFIGSDFCFYVK